MDLKTFFEHFGTLAEAPNGIQRFRELILDMAVRGKLVPQDPQDKSAAQSLQLMQQEKVLAEKARGRKAKKPSSKKNEEDYALNFPLPKSWILSALDSVCLFIDYRGKTPEKAASGIRLVTAKNVRDGFINIEPREFVTEKTYEAWMTRGIPKKGDVLFTTEAPLGKAAVVNIAERFALAQRVINLHPFSGLDGTFLMWLILSPWFQNELVERATGMTAKGIKAAKLKIVRVPLPPLAEQKRIVAKVDELMGLCDALEAAQQTRNALRKGLRASALDALMNATSDDELATAWAFVRDHWGMVSDRPEDVEGLRKLILEAASRGRLVDQIFSEGRGEIVLRKSIEEREKLASRNCAQKPKARIPVTQNESPFPLPETWDWARIEDICTHIVDCLHRTPKYQFEGYPAIRTSEMTPGFILHEQAKRVGKEEYKRQTQRLLPKAGDIFYSREGNYGIAAVVPPNIEMCLSQRMMQFRLASKIHPEFFSWIMNASVMFDQAVLDAAGMTVPHVNIRALRKFVFPLPPLAEQKRIVAKVDELMQLCDQLEESLRQQQQYAQALVTSTISHLAA